MNPPTVDPPRPPAARRERSLAAALCLIVAGLAIGRPLVDPTLLLPSLGSAVAHEPWRTAIGPRERVDPRPDLSDQGMAFYPARRSTARSLLGGEVPVWNPDIFAGVPWLANPQWGVLDPQVLAQVAVERLFGRVAFDWSFAWLAWLRLAGAGLGAWCLARRLAIGRRGAALAAASFALSGINQTWLGFPVGHVTFLLPWLLLAVERVGACAASVLPAALLAALVVLGGHPETSFFVGGAAAAWALAGLPEDRRSARRALGGLVLGAALAAPLILPFVEYLARSAALDAHRQAVRVAAGTGVPWLVPLGFLLACSAGLAGIAHRRPSVPDRLWSRWLWIAPASTALCLLLARWGWTARAGAIFFHDLYGPPVRSAGPAASAGYRGPAAWIEIACTWLPTATLVLALAAVLDRRARIEGRLRVAALAAAALLLALRVPGAIDLWRLLPWVGGAATERATPVCALMLALLAGAGLERASRAARAAAALCCAALAGLVILAPTSGSRPQADPVPAETDELLALLAPLPRRLEGGELELHGWVHAGLGVDAARLVATSASTQADPPRSLERGLELRAPAAEERAAGVPEGATVFRARQVEARHLGQGEHRLEIVLAREGRELGRRYLGTVLVEHPRAPAGLSLVLAGCALLACLVSGRRLAAGTLALTVAQGLLLAARAHAPTPRSAAFPATRTTDFLSAQPGLGRVLGGPGVLPYDTGLAHGLRMLDGYDALDPADFDAFRIHALRAGAHPILDWNAAGVDLDSPAFRLLGVEWIASIERIAHPAWELVAGPEGARREAEVYVYRASDPLPRAFVVTRIVERESVLSDPAAFDPRSTAFLDAGADLSFARPCTSARVVVESHQGSRVRLTASLDGEGLLVLAEQSHPGWKVAVDGRPRRLWTVDSIFRGVVLGPGTSRVEFRYEPASLRWGVATASLALVLLLLDRLRARTRAAG